ncbi:MAG: DNA topoisomerase (ATP-hydrolyzing) subunit A [Prochloraceae cyanobacterium]
MVKENYLSGNGQIIPTALHVEMERSYLEYAMSVIVGRALPDVRDGLKPVHRRILYAMHELGLTPDRPYRKCARVVGDVLGKYHPHGDKAVYDALVRMVQEFSSRYPLLSGHGNFGSVDNDPPAAMRYTETKLAAIAHRAMLSEIGEATVNFTTNFDNSQQEPVVLPAQLPLLLLNGCSGIAVGMATNIPPHNLSEVVDGAIALIDKPDLADEKLWQLIPGPDFPTGGQIIETSAIKEFYRTGRGIIKVRGVVQIERFVTGKRRRVEKSAIIVTELPYQVNKAAWIEQVAGLVNNGRLEGISDLRDESDRNGMRVVVELKKDTDPQDLLQRLYQQSYLESKFGAILLALVDKKPSQLSLRRVLTEFLEFREQTLTRQYTYELEQARKRLHLLEGLTLALDNLDEAIDILRNAPDGSSAKIIFLEKLGITPAQADSILAMPMRRLTGLERQKLQEEYSEKQEQIANLEKLLGDRHELMKALKKELRSLKRQFGDPRRTRIVSADSLAKTPLKSSKSAVKTNKNKQQTLDLNVSNCPPKNSILTISHSGAIGWQETDKNNKPSAAAIKKGEDFIVDTLEIEPEENLIVITDNGKAYPLAIKNIPHYKKGKITPLKLLSQTAQKNAQKTVAHFLFPKNQNLDLILLTEKGRIKRLPTEEIKDISNRGSIAIKLKEKDCLNCAYLVESGQELAIATSKGRIIRLMVNDNDLPIMGRNAIGDRIVRLRYGETLAGCRICDREDNLLLVSGLGYAKRLPFGTLRQATSKEIINDAIQFSEREDVLAGIVKAEAKGQAVLFTNKNRRLIVKMKSVPFWGKEGTGDSIVNLKSGEKIVAIAAI